VELGSLSLISKSHKKLSPFLENRSGPFITYKQRKKGYFDTNVKEQQANPVITKYVSVQMRKYKVVFYLQNFLRMCTS